MTDNDIMFKVKNGQREALAMLYEKYKQDLFTYAFYQLHDRFEAEDVVQNAFVKVLKHSHKYDNNYNCKAWLYTICRNLVKDQFRKRKTRRYMDSTEMTDELIPDPEPGVDLKIATRENHQLLHRLLMNLDKEQREILILVKLNEMRYKEVAKILNMTEGHLRIVIFRAMKKLKLLVEQNQIGLTK